MALPRWVLPWLTPVCFWYPKFPGATMLLVVITMLLLRKRWISNEVSHAGNLIPTLRWHILVRLRISKIRLMLSRRDFWGNSDCRALGARSPAQGWPSWRSRDPASFGELTSNIYYHTLRFLSLIRDDWGSLRTEGCSWRQISSVEDRGSWRLNESVLLRSLSLMIFLLVRRMLLVPWWQRKILSAILSFLAAGGEACAQRVLL